MTVGKDATNVFSDRLSHSSLPECQKFKNGGLDQYGAEPFEQQQLGTG